MRSWRKWGKSVSDFERLKLQSLLTDHHTGLPTLACRIPEIRQLWDVRRNCTVLAFIAIESSQMEGRMGWQEYDQMLKRIAGNLKAISDVLAGSILTLSGIRGDEFYLFVPPSLPKEELLKEVLRVLSRQTDVSFLACAAEILPDVEGTRWERTLYRSVAAAREGAILQGKKKEEDLYRFLKDFVANPAFSLEYQPIYLLSNRAVLGLECLFRLPQNAPFIGNEIFFAFAEKTEYITRIENRIWERAHAEWESRPETLLFFNTTPTSLMESDVFLDGRGRRVVLEITERVKIPDWVTFKARLARLHERGLKIAIDDVGAGYGSLQAVLELQPDYIKIDASLIRGIESHPIKRSLIASLVDAAQKMGSAIIAECIETQAELESLVALGVPLGQGFYLKRPAAYEALQ
jgi:EAL domain-containing protein (putative c-di-GMP-specific phosphodiesterase class I)